MNIKHLISIRDLSGADVGEVLRLALAMKKSPDNHRTALAGKTVGLLFQTPSTRTFVSSQVAIYQMGGNALTLREEQLQLSQGETLADTAQTLSHYVDAIVARVRAHADLVELSRHAGVPVINGLSDLLHPCQALADFLTLLEKKGNLRGKKIAFVGEGTKMCHSLLYGAIKVGMDIAVATPAGLEPKSIIVKSANREAKPAGVSLLFTQDPAAACHGADAVYTDCSGVPGQPSDPARDQALAPYQVNEELMSKARPDAVFMHCNPAFRGSEVAESVLAGPQSVVAIQAQNRLHVQKAIFAFLLKAS